MEYQFCFFERVITELTGISIWCLHGRLGPGKARYLSYHSDLEHGDSGNKSDVPADSILTYRHCNP